MNDSRFIVGIDLGTTNIAVSYIDSENGSKIERLPIAQSVAVGEVDTCELLPSFALLPDNLTFPENAFSLDWGEPEIAVGVAARDVGADYPQNFIASTKSWLCHAGVDRKAEILPWNSEGVAKRSPLTIVACFLKHVISAWNNSVGKELDKNGDVCILENQQVSITIPASFDEVARELTLEAAQQAGFKNIFLLEEPLAVFYSWLNSNGRKLEQNDSVLVCDIGGGTTDFSLIQTTDDGNLVRSVAGEHLLLGGDNFDNALTAIVERKMDRKLSGSEWGMVCQKCRRAKEELLTDLNLDKAEVILQFKGSSIIANTFKVEISREDVESLINDGFFPEVDSSVSTKRSGGLQSMGLPYAKDPAVTKHIAEFLRYAARMLELENEIFQPTHILFNGGSVIPKSIRDRITAVISSWFDAPVLELNNKDLSTAVSIGAAYFGNSRRGKGVKVKSGTNRSFYLQIDSENGHKYLCVMPRGVDENCEQTCEQIFHLTANQKASFPLFCSSTRISDQIGDILEDYEELTPLARLVTAFSYGKGNHNIIDCQMKSKINEVGILELSLNSEKTDHSWPLVFDIRLATTANEVIEVKTVDAEKLAAADKILQRAFAGGEAALLDGIFKHLEKALELGRKEWSLTTLRHFSDVLLAVDYKKLTSKKIEATWLNLCGFCLRPGFGDPADELRLKKVWRLWLAGMNNERDRGVCTNWWIFWRRVASGLKPSLQNMILPKVMKVICPKGKYQEKIRDGEHIKAEMWRTVSVLEHADSEVKEKLASAVVEQSSLSDAEMWALARLAGRKLIHAPLNKVMANSYVETLLQKLIEKEVSHSLLPFTLNCLAAKTGNRAIDLNDEIQAEVIDYARRLELPADKLRHLFEVIENSEQETSKILGDSVPLGLRLK